MLMQREGGLPLRLKPSFVSSGSSSPPPIVPTLKSKPNRPLKRGLPSGPRVGISDAIKPSSVVIAIISARSKRLRVSCLERPSERISERAERLVERPDVRNNGPKRRLARAQIGTAVEESNTPVEEATKRPKKLTKGPMD